MLGSPRSPVKTARMPFEDQAPSGSLSRGLLLLSIIARSPRRGMGLSELAEHAGFDKATSHRLARILVRHGWLVQDEETRRYRLGVRVLDLGFAYLAGLDLRERALPHMERLGRDFGGGVGLAPPGGAGILYPERNPGRPGAGSPGSDAGSR